MIKVCRPLKVEVFRLKDEQLLEKSGWQSATLASYTGLHGINVLQGEHDLR